MKRVERVGGLDAESIYRDLLRKGLKVWGVVCSPDSTEIYYSDDEKIENIEAAIIELKTKVMQVQVEKTGVVDV